MASLTRRVIDWAAAFEDGAVIRAAFFGLLTATGVILYLDYTEMSARTVDTSAPDMMPVLPAFDPAAPAGAPGPAVTTPEAELRAPLQVVLGSGGILSLTGTIDPGSADRVQAELDAHGEYVRTVALNSPGGSVTDALAIGQLVRDHGFTTSVAAGALCASSCPLVLAGGKVRIVTAQSAVGVHQIYAAIPRDSTLNALTAAGTAMADAQTLTARISRYLAQMGVDTEIWLRALETPANRLTYLSADDLKRFKLATEIAPR